MQCIDSLLAINRSDAAVSSYTGINISAYTVLVAVLEPVLPVLAVVCPTTLSDLAPARLPPALRYRRPDFGHGRRLGLGVH